VPQDVHVIDAVRPGGHPSDQAGDLQVRVHPGRAGDRDVLTGQVRQAAWRRETAPGVQQAHRDIHHGAAEREV
jgi:hypothetical protein